MEKVLKITSSSGRKTSLIKLSIDRDKVSRMLSIFSARLDRGNAKKNFDSNESE
jgi:hypothetical protein